MVSEIEIQLGDLQDQIGFVEWAIDPRYDGDEIRIISVKIHLGGSEVEVINQLTDMAKESLVEEVQKERDER